MANLRSCAKLSADDHEYHGYLQCELDQICLVDAAECFLINYYFIQSLMFLNNDILYHFERMIVCQELSLCSSNDVPLLHRKGYGKQFRQKHDMSNYA